MRKETVFFRKASPVWAVGRENEMNMTLGFFGEFEWPFFMGTEDGEANEEELRPVLCITGSSLYRIFLNGIFIGHGPARAAHGYCRADEIKLPAGLLSEHNTLSVEVAGYCAGSFYLLDQPSFLQAEVRAGERVLVFTGSGPGSMSAASLPDRIQKVQRYSFQRVFTEAYRLTEDYSLWRTQGFGKKGADGGWLTATALEETDGLKLLQRHVPYCSFPVLEAKGICGRGIFEQTSPLQEGAPALWEDRSYTDISQEYKGYPARELELLISGEMDRVRSVSLKCGGSPECPMPGETSGICPLPGEGLELGQGEFAIAAWEYNASGFLGARIECEEDCVLTYVFDEVLTEEGDVCYNRMFCVNAIRFELERGRYDLETIQPYTQKYGKWMVMKGKARLKSLWVREYLNPQAGRGSFECSDPAVNGIFEAGRRTFAQNAADLYTDCPSRERAGWLCDSFFMGRVEAILTGNTLVEDNFLENYCLPDHFGSLPEGMLPMCYPADQADAGFIPNWALWMILELEEYRERKPGETVSVRMLGKVEKLFGYFEGFENERGLLEDLKGWIFVEWSRANDLVSGVNFPSNMLYSAALKAAGRIYGRKEWSSRGEKVAEEVRKFSYRGTFFADQALRRGNELVVQEESTEVCQYYAFFMGIADRETYPELFKILCSDFGPERNVSKVWAEVAPANAFIGNYLRIEMLLRYGLTDQILDETVRFFDYMVKRTGTLWENMGAYASCNHGFASHINWVCYRDLLGVRSIDYDQKCIELTIPRCRLTGCRGRIPVGGSFFEEIWEKDGDRIVFDYRAPEKYTVRVRSLDGLETVKMNLL